MALLTKSLFMNGEQCTKLLWYAQRKELPELTLSDKHKFAQGREFEKYVKKLFPDGVDLSEFRNEGLCPKSRNFNIPQQPLGCWGWRYELHHEKQNRINK